MRKKNVLKTWQAGLAYIKYNPLGHEEKVCNLPQAKSTSVTGGWIIL